MFLTELFGLGTTSTPQTDTPNKPTTPLQPKRAKTAKELQAERQLAKQQGIEKRKAEMKARAHKNGQRDNDTDSEEVGA